MKSFPPADSATRVLLVDAESSLRKTLETFLADEGYQLHTAENRQEAAERVRQAAGEAGRAMLTPCENCRVRCAAESGFEPHQ